MALIFVKIFGLGMVEASSGDYMAEWQKLERGIFFEDGQEKAEFDPPAED